MKPYENEKSENAPGMPTAPVPRQLPEFDTQWQREVLGLRVTHPDLQIAANKVEQFADGYFRNDPAYRKLVIYGPTGNGKTVMAVRLLRWAERMPMAALEDGHWNRPPQARLARWQSLCSARETGKSYSEVIDPLAEIQLLVLDDVGAESDRFKSGYAKDALSHLLNLVEGRSFVVITTNIDPDNWRERFDARIEDRLLREAIIVNMANVPSWSTVA